MQDIKAPREIYNHTHRWAFLTTKGTYQPIKPQPESVPTLFEFVEYAILICNGCTTVMKERIKTKGEVENGDAQEE